MNRSVWVIFTSRRKRFLESLFVVVAVQVVSVFVYEWGVLVDDGSVMASKFANLEDGEQPVSGQAKIATERNPKAANLFVRGRVQRWTNTSMANKSSPFFELVSTVRALIN